MNSSLAHQFLLRCSRNLPGYRALRFLPWLVLAIPLLVTFQLWRNAQTETELALQAEFNFNVLETSLRIEQQMLSYEELLRGVQGLFAASSSVERNEFRDYVLALNIDKNYPGVQGVGYTLLIPAKNKDKHVAEVRREGFPEYTIRPEGVRDTYSSVLYLEPFTGRNLHAFGYDNLADPLRRGAMEQVRDTGLCAISPKIKLVQEIDRQAQAGLLMWLPVYKNGLPHHDLASRRANFVGWVSASFRMDNLMASIFRGDAARVHIEIYDGDVISPQTLMHKADRLNNAKKVSVPLFQTTKKLRIAERNWIVVLTSLPEFDKRLSGQKPRLIAYAGITVSILLALISGMLVFGSNRALQVARVLNRELAERKRAEAGMRLAEKVFDIVDAAVLVTDKKTHIIKVNPAFTAITGYSAEEAIGKTPGLLSSGAHTPEFYQKMWQSLTATGSWQGEIYNRRKNGEFYTEWLSINEVRDSDGHLTNYVSLFSDISERKAAEAQMHNLAHHDPLTGLPNRTLLADRLQQAIAAARRERSLMALMFIDLDKFKPINDSLGHHIGDLLLKEVAKRVLECLRESDTAARIGGDEFVVLLPSIEEETDAMSVAEKIRHSLYETFKLAGHDLNISSSIGVVVYPKHGLDEKTLLRNADIAMYYAKEAGRNCVVRYEYSMKREIQ
jgi:diguanylate cyclase (GGDEF)-like protein/PAS domain S-box-containing protein